MKHLNSLLIPPHDADSECDRPDSCCLVHDFGLSHERANYIDETIVAHRDACMDMAAGTFDFARFFHSLDLELHTPTEILAAGYSVGIVSKIMGDFVSAGGQDAIDAVAMQSAPQGAMVIHIGPNGPRVVGTNPRPPDAPEQMPEGASIIASGNLFSRKTDKE